MKEMTKEEIAEFVLDAAARAGMEVSAWLRMTKVDAIHRPPPLAPPLQLAVERSARHGVEFEVWKRIPMSTQAAELVGSFREPVLGQPQLGDVVHRVSGEGGVFSVVKRRHEVGGGDPVLIIELERITDVTEGY